MSLKPLKTKERINILKNNPKRLYYFCRKVLKAPWPEAEPYILKDKFVAMHYAYHVKKKLWPELEAILDSDINNRRIYNWNMRHYTY